MYLIEIGRVPVCSVSDFAGMHSPVGNSSVTTLVLFVAFIGLPTLFSLCICFWTSFEPLKQGSQWPWTINYLQSAGSAYLCFFQTPFDCIVREARCLPAPILLPPINSKPRSVFLKPTFPKRSIRIRLRPSFWPHNFSGQYPRMTAANVREKSMDSREQKKPWRKV